MPDLQLQQIKRTRGRPEKSDKQIDWNGLSYREMVDAVERLAGPRPVVPSDISFEPWSSQAIKVLKERYFLKDDQGVILETTEELCWRVAWELARSEVKFGRSREEVIEYAREYYELMGKRWFLPNSPTLMNAGKDNGLQYSACYVLPVPDSLEGIFDGVKYQGLIHQSGGGTGFSFSRLRAKGSRVRSTMGVASGPISFMKIYNEATQQVKQGGMRRGANMGILRVDHPDILEFIHCKDDGVGITNFNISVTITDAFMDALAHDGEYELIAPESKKVVGKLNARHVWNEIAESAWKTGDPGLIFIDRINQSAANPIRMEGWEVESTNPCGEQPLYPFDACNLGSIFLGYFVTPDKKVDWQKLKEVTHTAVRMLDSVIEMNPFPLPQIAETVHNIRRIGLGVGGWADMLVELGIAYDSEKAIELAEEVMRVINTEGHAASVQLAKERGAFPLWKQSIYKNDLPIRNSTVTTIAPTGTIGILANASGGCEPLFAIAYQHIVKSENRTLTFVNPAFESMARQKGIYSEDLMKKVAEHGVIRDIDSIPADVRFVFGTAHEIEPTWHIRTQAAFQKFTDNAVSKTINLRNESTVDDVKRAYMEAWETGCRGITVFRDGCKNEQVLNLGTKNDKKEVVVETKLAEEQVIKPRPVKVEGATYKIESPMGHAFITVNHDGTGNPFEVFVTIGKAGSEVAAMAEALGRLISMNLRFGNHLPAKERARELMEQLQGIGGGRSVGFGPNRVRSLPDAVAKAIGLHFGFVGSGSHEQTAAVAPVQLPAFEPVATGNGHLTNGHANGQLGLLHKKKADLCPSCGEAAFAFEEGCKKCYACGYSEC